MNRVTRNDPQDAWMAEVLRARAEHSHPRNDCPRPERIWDAVRLQVSLDDRLGIIDHLAECPTCAEAWSLAAELEIAHEQLDQPNVTAPAPAGVVLALWPAHIPASTRPFSASYGRNALLIATGALFLALGIGFLVRRPDSQPPREATETLRPRDQQGATASLALQQLPPGTRVLMDNTLIGTVGNDGTLTYSGIAPGRHALQFAGRGFEPLTKSQEFASAETLTLSGADLKLVRASATLEVQADPGTEITIAQAGRTIQQLKGTAKLSLPEGAYDLVAKGPVGIPTTRPLKVTAGTAHTVDVRNAIVSGMERFDPAGWTEEDSWSTRRGGNFVLYGRTGSEGRISFTIRLDRNGNPFSSGSRLTWVVGYADSRNYVLLQLDKDYFYRRVVTEASPQTPTRLEHRIPTDVPYVNLRIQLSGTRLVHEYSTQANVWQTLDSWGAVTTAPATTMREILDGRFGFFLPGAEEIAISNFRYYPPTPLAAEADEEVIARLIAARERLWELRSSTTMNPALQAKEAVELGRLDNETVRSLSRDRAMEVESIRIEGRIATVQVKLHTILAREGQQQPGTSTRIMVFEKSPTGGWALAR